jgi:hypothetical protein
VGFGFIDFAEGPQTKGTKAHNGNSKIGCRAKSAGLIPVVTFVNLRDLRVRFVRAAFLSMLAPALCNGAD